MKARFHTILLTAAVILSGCAQDVVELDSRAEARCLEALEEPTDWYESDGWLLKSFPVHRDGCILSQLNMQLGSANLVGGSMCNACADPQDVSAIGVYESVPVALRFHTTTGTSQLSCLDSPEPSEVPAAPFNVSLDPGDHVPVYNFLYNVPARSEIASFEVLWPKLDASPATYVGAVSGHACLEGGALSPLERSKFSVQVVREAPQ